MDVMSSRAPDDRRAIEASLIKALESSDSSDEGRRRARQALEEYGFVARPSATIVLGPAAWERSSAARTFGQIKLQVPVTPRTASFHNDESVVRNQDATSPGTWQEP